MATRRQLFLEEQKKKKNRPLNEEMVNEVLSKDSKDVEEKTMHHKPRRTRKFCLVTYIDVGHLDNFLRNSPWVQHFAYCTHDRDVNDDGTPKQSHTHIVLYTYDAKTSSAIKKIFDNYSAEVYRHLDTEAQNTLVNECHDVTAQYRYLRHLDDPKKTQYAENEVYMDELPYWNNLSVTHGMTDSARNCGLAIFDDMINGVDTYTMIQRYGKEYIYHIAHYEKAFSKMLNEQRRATFKGFQDMCEFALADSTFTDKELKNFFVVLSYVQMKFNDGTQAFAEDTYRLLKS